MTLDAPDNAIPSANTTPAAQDLDFDPDVLRAKYRHERDTRVRPDGQVTIPRIDMAVDCGLVVNPDRVRAQLEGAAIMAISNVLYSNISARQGRIEQGNFDDYPVARIDITPDTRTYLVDSSAPPAGVGEPGVPRPEDPHTGRVGELGYFGYSVGGRVGWDDPVEVRLRIDGHGTGTAFRVGRSFFVEGDYVHD